MRDTNTIKMAHDLIHGGLKIPKKNGLPNGKQETSCSNPICGRSFAGPIKVHNLASKDARPYDACPYCLTEMADKLAHTAKKEKQKSEKRMPSSGKNVSIVNTAETRECSHHFGYLGEGAAKDGISEECMVCANLVKCMLKTTTP